MELARMQRSYYTNCSRPGRAQLEIMANVVAMYLQEMPELRDENVSRIDMMVSLDFESAHVCTTVLTTPALAVNDIAEAVIKKCHELPSLNLPRHNPSDKSFGTFRLRLKLIKCD